MINYPSKLSSRLTLWYVSTFAIFLVLLLIVLYWSINTILDRRIDEDLVEDIEEFSLLLESDGIEKVKGEIQREIGADDQDSVFIRLLNHQGQSMFSSDLTAWPNIGTDDERAIALLTPTSDPVLVSISIPKQQYDTRTIYSKIGPQTILHLGESMEEKEELMELLLFIFTTMSLAVIPLAGFIGWLMARRATRGIEEVSHTAALIQSGQLDKRVSVNAKEVEIQTLADTFNAMLDRIGDLIVEMREMTDHVAHDLRSPLARIRALAEGSLSNQTTLEERNNVAYDTIVECDRLLQMINATLDMAEAETGMTDKDRQDVNLTNLVEDACELFEPLAEQNGIQLTSSLDRNCTIYGNIPYLQRMLANLLDNALKYTRAGGRVAIEMWSDVKGATITITDTGVGITMEEKERVFERFFRGDQSRSQEGCGMGLSFARAIAQAHKGDITVESEPGLFTTFTVYLPARFD